MNDDLRDRLAELEQATGDAPVTGEVTVVLDAEYVDDAEDLPPGFVLSSEYDARGGR